MTKKTVRKRKLNIKKILLFLLIIVTFCLLFYFSLQIKTKNILIKGNTIYTDNEIIELLNIEDYPSFFKLNINKMKNNLEKTDLIKSVSIKRKLGFILEINIIENKILYQRKSDGLYVLDTGEEVNKEGIKGIPLLINYYPNTLESKALKAFNKLTQETIYKISSIEYAKTDGDNERFLLYMADGNLVYINLNRMARLNRYTEMINQFGTKKGVLNLDMGNNFEIKEK